MIGALKALFETPANEDPGQREQRIRLAAAALLIETARADFTQDAAEQAALERLLTQTLALDPAEIRALIADAESRVDEATSLYEFTRVINDHYSAEQKLQLIDSMWSVAFADGNLDKYEEHLIRQVAELTYVPHPDYIRSKLAAQG
tara:strand:- start:38183 stop:38623 length:441 start_codon:yes stop_codon:yes gene_type:complete